MRIPSTSDLCQAHSNRAYDKMEVISDHIHELMDLYEWIFNLRAYLASLLTGYVTIGTDQTVTGKKTFENLKAHVLNIANATEVLNEGYVTTGYYNDSDPALIIHFTAYDDDVPYETRLYLVSRPGGNPYFVIPPTNADDDNSAVRLDYLRSVLATLNDGSAGLANRIAALENKMDAIYPFDSEPSEGSIKGVTSGGVFDAIQDAINNIEFPATVFPVATAEQKGIMQVGEYLTVNNGVVGVDADALATYIRQQLNLNGFDSGLLTYTSVSGGFTIGYNGFSNDPDDDRYAVSDTNPALSDAIDITDTTQAFFTGNTGAGNDYLEPKVKGTAVSTIGVSVIKCTNTSSGASNYYIPLRTVIIRSVRDVTLPSYHNGLVVRDYYIIKCWFRNRDYTLQDVDKLEINDQANAFIAARLYSENTEGLHVISDGSGTGTYTPGDDVYYDTGALS